MGSSTDHMTKLLQLLFLNFDWINFNKSAERFFWIFLHSDPRCHSSIWQSGPLQIFLFSITCISCRFLGTAFEKKWLFRRVGSASILEELFLLHKGVQESPVKQWCNVVSKILLYRVKFIFHQYTTHSVKVTKIIMSNNYWNCCPLCWNSSKRESSGSQLSSRINIIKWVRIV